MRCGVSSSSVSSGGHCSSPGDYSDGCIYEVPWESLGLGDTGTDATLKYVPREDGAYVIGFIVDFAQTVQAATGPGYAGFATSFMSALTRNGRSYMPNQSSSVGAALSLKYSLSAFAREVSQRAGGPLQELLTGEGTPWAQFGIHDKRMSDEDDVTVTIENQSGLDGDFGGTFQVLIDHSADRPAQ